MIIGIGVSPPELRLQRCHRRLADPLVDIGVTHGPTSARWLRAAREAPSKAREEKIETQVETSLVIVAEPVVLVIQLITLRI